MRGKYIVIEGQDGTGKSTQVQLLREKLDQQGIKSIEFHEPEGSPIANEIRTIIKDGNLLRDPETNLLLFTAARHEIWKSAKKQLEKGTWVVAARNYFSTLAYQGYGEGLDLELIKNTTKSFTDDTYMHPDLVIVLDLDNEKERGVRINQRGKLSQPDTFEIKEYTFQKRVRDGYIAIAKNFNLPILQASHTAELVNEQILQLINRTA